MRVAFSMLMSAVAAASLRAAPRSDASFDCAMAILPAEEAICASARLALMDRILADDYQNTHRMLERWMTAQEADSLQTDQKKWLDSRNACGSDVDCLERAMESRRKDLEARASSSWLGALRRIASEFPAGKTDFSALSTDGKVRFFSKADFERYEHPESERSRKRAAGFPMSKSGSDSLEITDCAGYLDARAQGYGPGPLADMCGTGERTASQFDACELIWLMKGASKPKTSAIPEVSLPSDLWIFFNGGRSGYRHAGELAKPSILGLGYASERAEGTVSPESSVEKITVTPLAVADFNGDGLEDVLVKIETEGKGYCHQGVEYNADVTRYQLLSRASPNEELRPISEPCSGGVSCVPKPLGSVRDH